MRKVFNKANFFFKRNNQDIGFVLFYIFLAFSTYDNELHFMYYVFILIMALVSIYFIISREKEHKIELMKRRQTYKKNNQKS